MSLGQARPHVLQRMEKERLPVPLQGIRRTRGALVVVGVGEVTAWTSGIAPALGGVGRWAPSPRSVRAYAGRARMSPFVGRDR